MKFKKQPLMIKKSLKKHFKLQFKKKQNTFFKKGS